MIYTPVMLRCAHKDLLLDLARSHADDLRASLRLAKVTLGPTHVSVGEIKRRLELAEDTVRSLETEPPRVAA